MKRACLRLAQSLLLVVPLAASWAADSPAPDSSAHPATALIQRAIQASRDDPEDSRRLADEALALLDLRRPDAALYEAKAAGRDRVHAGSLVLAA